MAKIKQGGVEANRKIEEKYQAGKAVLEEGLRQEREKLQQIDMEIWRLQHPQP